MRRRQSVKPKGDRVLQKVWLSALMLIFFNHIAFAQLNDKSGHTLALSVSLGALAGDTEEIVYIDGTSRDRLSLLIWEIKPLFYAGLDIHYGWQSKRTFLGAFSDVNLKFGIPAKTGVLEDRDWFDSSENTYPYWLTHYSEHENKTKAAVLLDFRAGVSFKLNYGLKLSSFLSYSLMFYSWDASSGSYLYPWTGGHSYNTSSEKVITYKQQWHIVSPGVSFSGAFNRFFGLELSLKLSPLIWLVSVDDHIKTNTVYTDMPRWGFFMEPALLFSFDTGTFVSLLFSYSFRYITGSRGDSFDQMGEIINKTYNVAGAAYSVHDFGITAKFTIFNL